MLIQIKLVVPRKDYIKSAMERFETIESQEPSDIYDGHSFQLEEVVIPTEQVTQAELDADVLISRGLVTKLLKESDLSIPVVDIPVQGTDLIRSLVDCKRKFGRKKVAVIGAANMIFGVEGLEEIIDLPIGKYVLNDIQASRLMIEQALSDGCEIVLSGLNTCKVAERLAIPSIVVETGEESFRQAVIEAKRIALVSRQEQERARRFQTILDHAYEGVIAVDNDQKVTVCNQSAQDILSIEKSDLDHVQVKEVLNQGQLLDVLLSDQDYTEELLSYEDIQLSVKKAGVFLKGKRVGSMVAFQDVTGIQEMERKIRKKIHSRGHVAKYEFKDILYKSEWIAERIRTAKRFSRADSNILIYGETGTGKELFAQSIHNNSDRRHHPFVAINCAALPESLLESELFGYVEGAFTGAMRGGKQGIFELAHQGTLLLDEVGEIPPKLQSRLLRVLQEKEIMRIGDDKVIPVDVRIIAATNRDVMAMVRKNEFRSDLYYRLAVLELDLPPLREHVEDIPLLAGSFLKREHQRKVFSDQAMRKMMNAQWEGNVRQLQNFCERMHVLTDGAVIEEEDVVRQLPAEKEESFLSSYPSEKNRILKALEDNQFHKGRAAHSLGMSRTTFWRKLKSLGIET